MPPVAMSSRRDTTRTVVVVLLAVPLLWWGYEILCKPFLSGFRKQLKKDEGPKDPEDED